MQTKKQNYHLLFVTEDGSSRYVCEGGILTETGVAAFRQGCQCLSEGQLGRCRVFCEGELSEKKGLDGLRPVSLKTLVRGRALTSGFLCNHTLREYIDIAGIVGDDCLNPLALLCCNPACRCKGDGDYYYREGFEDVSRWYGHVLSACAQAPEGYSELIPSFTANGTPVWRRDNLKKPILGRIKGGPLFGKFLDWLFDVSPDSIRYRTATLGDIRDKFIEFLGLVDAAAVRRAYTGLVSELLRTGGREGGMVKVEYRHSEATGADEPVILFGECEFHPDVKDGHIDLGSDGRVLRSGVAYIVDGWSVQLEDRKEYLEYCKYARNYFSSTVTYEFKSPGSYSYGTYAAWMIPPHLNLWLQLKGRLSAARYEESLGKDHELIPGTVSV